MNTEMLMTLGYENQKGVTLEVRSFVDVYGAMQWAATDVCAVLEIRNPSQAIAKLDDDEKQNVSREFFDTLINNEGIDERVQNLAFINESGLYSIIMRSRKKEAKRFKKWVTSEVLPSIRKTGRYNVAEAEMEKLTKHGNRETQIDMSKKAASFYMQRYGKQGIARYYSWTCKGFTGRPPEVLKAEAKALKVPSVNRSSGRECIRTFWPETAACVSSQDEMIVKDDYHPRDAHEAARLLEPYFKHRRKLGKLNSGQPELFDTTEYTRRPRKLDARILPNPFPPQQLTIDFNESTE